MVSGETLARKIVGHLNVSLGRVRKDDREVRRVSDNCVNIFGIRYTLDVTGKEIDILIEPPEGEEPEFEEHIRSLETEAFWQDGRLNLLKEKRRKYAPHLRNKKFYKNGSGNYHFKAQFATGNKDKAMYALLNYVIKPTWLFVHKT